MVSVIIPVYNAEKTLESCVRSLLAQTYTDFELLLIDDGSKDRSGQLCDELQKMCGARNVRCRVIHKENGGVSSARNCGMDCADGAFFVCVDSDDVVEPCYLEDLVRTAEAHPEFGHVICGFKCTSHVHDYVLTDREPLTVVDRRDYMRLYEKVLIQSPCLGLYRTDVVCTCGIKMREDLSLGEDILFNLTYLDAIGSVPIGVVNKANYLYRDETQDSMNRKYRPDLQRIFETIDGAVADYLRRWEITDPTSWQSYYRSVFYHGIRAMDNTFHRQNEVPLREKLASICAILRQDSFQEALEKSGVVLPDAQRRALASGNYRRVMLAERVQKWKQAVRRLLK
jgi:glycosyltransferase involved in cell wall biosynthesis